MKSEFSKNIFQAISVLNSKKFIDLYHNHDFKEQEYFLGISLFPRKKKRRLENFFDVWTEYVNGVAPNMYYDSVIRAWLDINGNTELEIDPIRRESAKLAVRRQWRDQYGYNPLLEHVRIYPEGLYIHPYNYLMLQALLEGYRDNNPNRSYTNKLNFG